MKKVKELNVKICGYTKDNEYIEVFAYSFPRTATAIDICKTMKNVLKAKGMKIVVKIVEIDNGKNVIYAA